MFIIVCYTDIDDPQKVAAGLTTLTDILQWTIDLDDCDKVLRIVARRNIAKEVREAVQALGYVCWVVELGEAA